MICKNVGVILLVFVSFSFFTITNGKNYLKNAVTDFAVNLFENVTGWAGDNIVISPLLIQSNLALLDTCAEGKTDKELDENLFLYNQKTKRITARFHNILRKLRGFNGDGTTIKVASKLFVSINYPISWRFNDALSKFYASVASVDYSDQQEAAQEINDWVSYQTNKKITKILNPSVILADTEMLLVNGLYFQGLWKYQFNKKLSSMVDFWVSQTDTKKMEMMFITNTFHYGTSSSLDAVILELPYSHEALSMFIILPNKRLGITTLETSLSIKAIQKLEKHMSMTTVNVAIPFISIGFQMDYRDVLTAMGMGIAFTSDADFQRIVENGDSPKITDVCQKVHFKATENGADASASDSSFQTTSSSQSKPMSKSTADSNNPSTSASAVTFNADHPFVFYVKYKKDIFIFGTFNH